MKSITIKNGRDTFENISSLILKVETLISKTTGDIQRGWKMFLRECKEFIFNSGVTVTNLKDGNYIVGTAKFECKINDLNDYLRNQQEYPEYVRTERIQVRRIIKMNKKSFNLFSNNCMMYTNFFGSNFGGTDCLVPLEKRFPQYNFEEMEMFQFQNLLNEDQTFKKIWDNFYCQICALIICEETGQKIICNSQGYNYSKYTAFEFSLNK